MGASAAIATIGLGLQAGSAVKQMELANEADEIRRAQIRQQQVDLRLQQTQRSIKRMRLLREALANTTVAASAGGIAPGSATIRAINQRSIANFTEDEAVDRLNFDQKQIQTNFALANSELTRKAQVFGAVSQFGMNLAKLGFNAYSAPSQSLLAASNTNVSTTNSPGSFAPA